MKINTEKIYPWLDILALLAWGILLLKYWLTGQLKLLIHINYFWLTLVTGICLIILSTLKALQMSTNPQNQNNQNSDHITLFPPGFGSGLLLFIAIISFIIPPTILTSDIALQRGVSESLPVTQTQTQSFRVNTKSEERSLIDWVRTLNAYPEPDAYTGQKAKVTGFVIHLPELEDNYILISRFIITCCAVDAYPIGIPVKLEGSRNAYPADTWIEVQGQMITETLPSYSNITNTPTQKRQLVIGAQSIQKIPTPTDPYIY